MSEYPMRTIAAATYGENGLKFIGVRVQGPDDGLDGWLAVFSDGSYEFVPDTDICGVKNLRRLAVLDLNDSDRDDLIRYLSGDHRMGVYDRNRVIRQIHEQTQPPKPEEPKHAAAKVSATTPGMDGGHSALIRAPHAVTGSHPWMDIADGATYRWSELSDVTLGWSVEDGAS